MHKVANGLQIYYQKYLRKTKRLTTFALNQILEFRVGTELYGKCRYLGPCNMEYSTVAIKTNKIPELLQKFN